MKISLTGTKLLVRHPQSLHSRFFKSAPTGGLPGTAVACNLESEENFYP
jgi:hypothetical protein